MSAQKKHRLGWLQHAGAFTLLEIMIIVSLIAVLVVLALPSFSKARLKSQGSRVVSDARLIDGAVDAWAMDNNLTDGTAIDLVQAGKYTKTGTLETNDILGNPYAITAVGTNQVRIAAETKSALRGVSIDWGAY